MSKKRKKSKVKKFLTLDVELLESFIDDLIDTVEEHCSYHLGYTREQLTKNISDKIETTYL